MSCRPAPLLLLFLIACGGGSSSPDAGPPRDAADPDPLFAAPHGSLRIVEASGRSDEGDYSFTRVSGHIGAEAPASTHSETMRDGACRLLEFDVASCDPWCDGVCVDTDVCLPWPSFESAGAIAVTGLETALTMTPRDSINWYDSTVYPLPEDLFVAGAAINATAAGATIAGFSIDATGVADLEADIAGINLTIADGVDATVTWTSAGGADRVRLTINSPNQGHGLPYRAILECDGPDSGSLTIPRALVEAMPPLSGQMICVSIDCPLSTMARYSRGTTTVDGRDIELVIASEIQFGVIHE